MAKSKIRSKAERTVLIRDFLASGLEKTASCKEKGIPYTTFCKWMVSYKKNRETVRFVALTEQLNDMTAKAVTVVPLLLLIFTFWLSAFHAVRWMKHNVFF